MNIHTDQDKSFDASEIPFGFEELFYSRTDGRGVIAAGNSVFQRVAGFEWDKLIGAPHKIVRHPDMPKSLFRILWNAIGKGHPMGVYVKNRNADGGWYWVYAIVLRLGEGYISVRLKPSSAVFGEVRKVYAAIREKEESPDFDLEEGAIMLRSVASRMGFAGYTNLMAYAIGQELRARDAVLGRVQEPRTKILIGVSETLERAAIEQSALLRSFEALQSIPNNMRLVASRLEPSGGPVSAISENYKASSVGISERLRSFVGGRGNLCERMSHEVAQALFLLGATRVFNELIANFNSEQLSPMLDRESERALLAQLTQECASNARDAMVKGGEAAAALSRASADIRRQMLGLDTIRVLGRVECGRMREQGGGLSAAIDQLDTFHADIKARLEALMSLSDTITLGMVNYLREAS
jgi:aerotaxis receptor